MLKVVVCITILSTSALFCASRSSNPDLQPVISPILFCHYFGQVSEEPHKEMYYNTFVAEHKKLLTELNPDAQNHDLRIEARKQIVSICALLLSKKQFEELPQNMKTCIAQELFIEMMQSRRKRCHCECCREESGNTNVLPSNIERHFRGLSIQNFIDHNFPILSYPVAIAPEYQFSRCEARLNNLRLSSLDGLRNVPDIEKCDTIILDNNAPREIPPFAFSNFKRLQKVFLRNNPITSLSPLCFVAQHNEHEIQHVFLPLLKTFEFLLPGILVTFTKPYLLTDDPKETNACEALKEKLRRCVPLFSLENPTQRLEQLFTTHKPNTTESKKSAGKKTIRKKKNGKASIRRRKR